MSNIQDTLDDILSDITLAKRWLNTASLRLEDAVKKLKYLSKGLSGSTQICPPVELEFNDLYRNVLLLQAQVNLAIGSTKVGDGTRIASICDIFAIESEPTESQYEDKPF